MRVRYHEYGYGPDWEMDADNGQRSVGGHSLSWDLGTNSRSSDIALLEMMTLELIAVDVIHEDQD